MAFTCDCVFCDDGDGDDGDGSSGGGGGVRGTVLRRERYFLFYPFSLSSSFFYFRILAPGFYPILLSCHCLFRRISFSDESEILSNRTVRTGFYFVFLFVFN